MDRVQSNPPDARRAPSLVLPEPGPASLIPWQGSLDPLTGLVSESKFRKLLAASRGLSTRETSDMGIIAVRLEIPILDARPGSDSHEGLLLLATEILHASSQGHEGTTARIGAADFAMLTRMDGVMLAATAARIRDLLHARGIPARVGWAMGDRPGGLGAALALAQRRRLPAYRSTGADEVAAASVLTTFHSAAVASALHGQATGILMQWHGCGPDRARVELALQAHELGLSSSAMARLVIAVFTGRSLDGGSAAHGIELDRTAWLGAPETGTAATLGVRRRGQPTTAVGDPPVSRATTVQPIWKVTPPNAATTRVLLLSDPRAGASQPRAMSITGRYQAALSDAGSGGDWFDAFTLPDGAIALAVGDVAGHDTLAATLMLQLRTMVRTYATSSDVNASDVLRRVDRDFVAMGVGRFATVLFGLISIDNAGATVLRWCNAGHLPPVLVGAKDGSAILPSADDLLLGFGDEADRSELSMVLPADSTLILYSDGLVETRAADINEGVDRLRVVAEQRAALAVDEMGEAVLTAMVGHHTTDDVTLLALRVGADPSVSRDVNA